jgi:hypothetical protein
MLEIDRIAVSLRTGKTCEVLDGLGDSTHGTSAAHW